MPVSTGSDESGAAGPGKGDKAIFDPENPWDDPDHPGFGPAAHWGSWRSPDNTWDSGAWGSGGGSDGSGYPTETPLPPGYYEVNGEFRQHHTLDTRGSDARQRSTAGSPAVRAANLRNLATLMTAMTRAARRRQY